eukprot:TRINITY_DN41_c0_g3_i1.p1 TRINITY_DN41_c0_g3~~TRINITY_DN41_c0_g3_i1.p1  ORF type:complete len:1886 (+),score=463.20 TRINITY_DN41_c0_g3_i1:37-5694(+)
MMKPSSLRVLCSARALTNAVACEAKTLTKLSSSALAPSNTITVSSSTANTLKTCSVRTFSVSTPSTKLVSLYDVIPDKKIAISVAPVVAESSLLPTHTECLDGNEAAVHVAYAMSDNAFIFPITPATTMGELADAWAAQGRKNINGQMCNVLEMQSEGGAAGALHGSLIAGGFSTTFTSSQGLLLMVPNMYRIAGNLLPTVIHVSSRAPTSQGLSIFCDHGDVMATRQSGFALLHAHSVQECMDMALIAHCASLKSSIPFLHFFDGMRVSHEITKINVLDYASIAKFASAKDILEARQRQRDRGLHPNHPRVVGTVQGPDVFFQNAETCNPFYEKTPGIVQEMMDRFAKAFGRSYHLFDYYGHPQATRVIVMLGSGSYTAQEVVDKMNQGKEKVGIIRVRLFRPFSVDHLLAAIPASCRYVTVLERTKEAASAGEPLYQDVCTAIQEATSRGVFKRIGSEIRIYGGRYGLGNKEFTPSMVESVFANMVSISPKNHFTVGINDDLTHHSLALGKEVHTVPKGTVECCFWGLGSDGTVGANKEAITLIGENTKLNVQGFFQFDAHKAGGVTVSHLRFGPKQITSSYMINQADYIACHHEPYIHKYDLLANAKEGAVFVLNTALDQESLIKEMPSAVKRTLAQKKMKLYAINARAIAEKAGLGKYINMVMQVCFFALSNVMPLDQALTLLKKAIAVTYGRKGDVVVQKNLKAVDMALSGLKEIPVPSDWANVEDTTTEIAAKEKEAKDKEKMPPFVANILVPFMKMDADKIPVSAFADYVGFMPSSLTKYEKRAVATQVPFWHIDKCTQCNYCSFVCPHAAVRPFLQREEDEQKAIASGKQPASYKTKKATGFSEPMRFSIQISPYDCTGCTLCSKYCPDHALEMLPIRQHSTEQHANWEYAETLPNYGHMIDKYSVRGSQFQPALLEFSGACDGCGETPYVKLITQLFGHRMMVANASGCSSVWAGSFGVAPYTVNNKGKGPAYGTSLFEDNAEYGLGMAKANEQLRVQLASEVKGALANSSITMSNELREALSQWLKIHKVRASGDEVCRLGDKAVDLLEKEKSAHEVLAKLYTLRDGFPLLSQWIIGGDGWAYDIGYGGLDHVLASGEKVNLLVLDNEVYSNTGGQKSKSTPLGAVVKFAAAGNRRGKKDLGMMAMSYGDVYVASIALGANMTQSIRAIVEADNHPGVSIIMAYVPCAMHGNAFFYESNRDKIAVDSGYWPLYRYNPALKAQGKNPFQLDSKKIRTDLLKFIEKDNRYSQLMRSQPAVAKQLNQKLKEMYVARHNEFKAMEAGSSASEGDKSSKKDDGLMILFGSETGNSEGLANRVASEAKRRGVSATVAAMDDCDFDALATTKQTVLFITSTCGQGKVPVNTENFFKWLNSSDLKAGALSNLKFAVFGLGDSNYVYFCKAAADLEKRLTELGAKAVVRRGVGNDQDEDKFETGWEEWEPEMWSELKIAAPPLPSGPAEAPYKIDVSAAGSIKTEPIVPTGSQPVALKVNTRITPLKYDRDIRHMEFDIKGKNMNYAIGDCLAIYGKNDSALLSDFLKFYGLEGDQVLQINPVSGGTLKPGLVAGPLTVTQLFRDVLDIFGRPTRRFYNELALFATDNDEKAALVKIGQDKSEYKKGLLDSITYADILTKYKSAKPSLAHLCHMIPIIKPRYYSIASSNNMYPDALHLCVVMVDWKTPSGKLRKGLTTNYISQLKPTEGEVLINCAVRRSAVEMPPNQQTPVIMAGLGTGVAPFRAFVQDRAFYKRKGEKVGPMVLYYGCRYRKQDFLYAEEFEQYEKEGIICEGGLRPACSRDQEKKIYVQHLIVEDAKRTSDFLLKQNGYFYICGPSRGVPEDVRNAVRKCFQQQVNMTKEEAEKTIVDLTIKGRYNVEAWS